MSDAKRDENFVPTMIGVSSADGTTPVTVYVDPTTHRMKVDFSSGGGTVNTVSVATDNGFAGTSDGDPSDPTLTLETTVTGILQGDGTAISAATTSGTGAVVLATSPTLVTPNIGTPSAGVLTNATGLPLTTGVTGILPLDNGGTGAALTDPDADRILFWDDSAGTMTWLTAGSGLSITGTTISTTGGGITVGTTTIASGTNTRVLYNNSGVVGEYAISGTGSVAMTNSPTLTTPDLGTPSAATLTNATGLPISTGVSGLGTGVATALGNNVGSAGAVVTFNGALGTPTSATLTNATGLPVSTGITGLGTNVATALGQTVNSSNGFVTASGTATLTNKTINASNNTLSNVPVSALADGTDGEIITWDASGNPTTVGPGTADQVLTSNGAGAAPSFQDAGGGGVTTETFTADGTWTKPAGATFVMVKLWGGGGGGGGGAGDIGGGGGGGCYNEQTFLAADLSSSESVTVGSGGAGGSGFSHGTTGEDTSFGSLITAYGGGGGGRGGGGSNDGAGGGGGGVESAGERYTSLDRGGHGGEPRTVLNNSGSPFMGEGADGGDAIGNIFGGGGGGPAQNAGNGNASSSYYGGGGGAGGRTGDAGNSYYGGGGGGRQTGPGGTSVFGGAGGTKSGTGDGEIPAGGGAGDSPDGGDGARGQVIVITW